MPKITSIDALIDRVKIAYPRIINLPDRIRDLMERDCYVGVYDILSNCGIHRSYSWSVSHKEILETVDSDGNVIPDKFTALIKQVREEIEEAELEKIRWKLQQDFKKSYEFTWISDF